MEFRVLEEEDFSAAKKLWKDAFFDSDAFIEFYFSRKVIQGNAIGLFDGGKLACCLHLIPYTIDLRGKPVETAYITAAATKEEYRNRGLMARLLKDALNLLRERDIPFTHLYPFLHAFYEKFGWAAYTDMKYVTPPGGNDGRYDVNCEPDIPGMARLYRRYTQGLTGHIVRQEGDFAYMLEEMSCDARPSAFARLNGELSAYALYEVQDAQAKCAETVFSGEDSLNALVQYIRETEGVKSVVCPMPANRPFAGASSIKPYGMARVADTQKLLLSLPLTDTAFVIEVLDEFAPWNTGVFEAVYSGGRAEARRTDKKPQARLTISDVAKLIHGTAGIRELVKNGGTLAFGEEILNILDKAFPMQNTFVFETY